MIQIPKKLQRESINFALLEKSGKKPFQQGWQKKEIKYNDKELIEHLNSNGNYGVMGGGTDNLVIVDFDNEDIEKELVKKLPKTFSVRTGSGRLHLYYFSDNSKSFKIFNEEMETLVDVQGEGKQVVGVGSIHPNGNKYSIEDDVDISFINYSELKAFIMPYDKKPKKSNYVYDKPKINITDDFVDRLKSSLSIQEVLSSFGIDTSKNPTECLFHSSKGGKCLGFDREVAHCFHCDGAWNIFSFVKEAKKCDFKEALDYLAKLAGLESELEESRKKYIESIKDDEKDEINLIRSQFLDLVSGKEKKWNEATEILVDYIKKKRSIYTTKEDVKSEMWVYNDGIYKPNGKSDLKELLRQILEHWYSEFTANMVISKIEKDTYIDSDEFFRNNEKYKDELCLENGILNIFSRELKPFTPDKIFFSKCPVKYNPQSKCSRIETFLSDIFPNDEYLNIYYEIGGFVLLKEYLFEKAFMFVGNGRNGKDKSLELIKRLIGVQNCTSIPLHSLNLESFIIAEFFGKYVNLAGDIGNQDLKETNAFKALTGRSLISAKRKFLRNIEFVNYAKFIFACNELPMVYDLSRGFWDRWVLLEFPYTFVTKSEFDKSDNKKFLKIKDDNIINKITTPEELSGLLNKFLDGLDRLTLNKKFSSSKSTEEVKNMWIKKSNSFVAFCMDNIIENYEGKITKQDLRKIYSNYCNKNKLKSKSDIVIKRVLEDMFGASELQETWETGGKRCWAGISWKT